VVGRDGEDGGAGAVSSYGERRATEKKKEGDGTVLEPVRGKLGRPMRLGRVGYVQVARSPGLLAGWSELRVGRLDYM
jgi:hypothetical protein